MDSVLLRARAALATGAAGLLLSPALLAAPAAPAAPTAAAASSDALAEIVVTAQRRSQRVQDVPISLSVMTGAELDKSSVQSVTDALGLVPGVAANLNGQGGQTTLTVRGVTAGGALFAGPSPIGYYLDSVPFGLVRSAVEPDSNTYDLNRVEVLRGPQGTLYGASALNGVVRVLTNDADVNSFDLKARASGSSTSGGGGNWRGDMAVNIPIVEGKLAARVVVGSEHDSGWVDAPVGNNINDTDSKNFRLKVTAQPTDDLSIKLSAMHQQTSMGAPSLATDDYSATLQLQPIDAHFNAYDLKLDYQAQAFTVSNSTSYFSYVNDGSLDIAPGAPLPPLTTHLTSRVFSEELTLNSRLQGPWRWSFGAFYRDARDNTYQTLGDLIPAPVSEDDTSKSYAVFGEVGRRFLDNTLELAVGARYFHDEVGLEQNILFGQPEGTPLIRSKTPFNAVTPRVVLTWFMSHDYTMYASYSEGFRSGFPQSELVTIVDSSFVPVKPDKLHNFEIGSKGSALDGKLIFDAAVYYMKWDDIQQTLGIPVPGANNTYIVANVNGKSVSGMGVDFAVTAHPMDGLSLGLNLSWNGLAEDTAVYSGGALLFPKGSRIDTSPSVTGGATAQYRFALGSSGWTGQLEALLRHTTVQTTTNASANSLDPPIVTKSDVITSGRVDFAVTAPTHWRAMLYCDNVSNNRGVPLASQTAYSSNSSRPRTTGLQLDYSFR